MMILSTHAMFLQEPVTETDGSRRRKHDAFVVFKESDF